MSNELEELYQDLILDHFKHPRCHGCLENANGQAELLNPLCGDQVQVGIRAEQGTIQDIAFTGKGCSISQASTSMMAEACKGKTYQEAEELIDLFSSFMHSECEAKELEKASSDLVALQGVRKFSARIKCALLGWQALKECINQAKK